MDIHELIKNVESLISDVEKISHPNKSDIRDRILYSIHNNINHDYSQYVVRERNTELNEYERYIIYKELYVDYTQKLMIKSIEYYKNFKYRDIHQELVLLRFNMLVCYEKSDYVEYIKYLYMQIEVLISYTLEYIIKDPDPWIKIINDRDSAVLRDKEDKYVVVNLLKHNSGFFDYKSFSSQEECKKYYEENTNIQYSLLTDKESVEKKTAYKVYKKKKVTNIDFKSKIFYFRLYEGLGKQDDYFIDTRILNLIKEGRNIAAHGNFNLVGNKLKSREHQFEHKIVKLLKNRNIKLNDVIKKADRFYHKIYNFINSL